MTNLLVGILVLFSSADNKLIQDTAAEGASYLERLYDCAVRGACPTERRPMRRWLSRSARLVSD